MTPWDCPGGKSHLFTWLGRKNPPPAESSVLWDTGGKSFSALPVPGSPSKAPPCLNVPHRIPGMGPGFDFGILCSAQTVLMDFGSPGAWALHATDTAWGHGQGHGLGTGPWARDSRENSSREDVHDKRCWFYSRLGLSPGTPFVLGTLARGRAISQKRPLSQNFLLSGSNRDHQTPKAPEPVAPFLPQTCSFSPPLGRLHLGGYSQENCQESSPSIPRSFSKQGEPARHF